MWGMEDGTCSKSTPIAVFKGWHVFDYGRGKQIHMKTTILRITSVAVGMMISAHVFAFTAVTSGLWSNAATWGGVGPGSTVTAQDIIIPTGITVDMDVNVVFNGEVNSFSVNGTLMSTGNHDLFMS